MKFKDDFFSLVSKLKNNENFAFTRFSDGEIAIMQNKRLILADDYVILGETHHNFGYTSNDHKNFDPEQHQFLREKLLEAYKYKAKNYFVGSICRNCNCASAEFKDWMLNEYGTFDDNYTFANLLVNSNYPLFDNHFVKALKNKEVVVICNESADLSQAPFKVIKDFRVGKNCIVNDWHLVDDIKNYIRQESIENTVFLFSASSLSEVLIYELYKDFNNNTYVDIGTTLHKQMKMELSRDYLKAYWNGGMHLDLLRDCNG